MSISFGEPIFTLNDDSNKFKIRNNEKIKTRIIIAKIYIQQNEID